MGIYTQLSQLFTGAVNAVDDVMKQQIDNEIFDTADKNLQDVIGGGQLLETSSINTKRPQEVDDGIKDVERMTNARTQGAIDENTYWARMQAQVKTLRSRYPGHRDYIDQRVAATTGGTPANKLREQAFAQQAKLAQAQKEERNTRLKLIEEYTEKGVINPNEFQAADGMSRLELIQNFGVRAGRKAQIEYQKADLELKKSRYEFSKDLENDTANKEANDALVNSFQNLQGDLGLSVKELDTRLADLQKKGSSASPEEVQGMMTLWANVQKQADDAVQGILAKYPSLDNNQRKNIVENYQNRLGSFRNAIENQQWGVLRSHFNSLQLAQTKLDYEFIQRNPRAAKAAAAGRVLGPAGYSAIAGWAIDSSEAPIVREFNNWMKDESFGGDTSLVETMNQAQSMGVSEKQAASSGLDLHLRTINDPNVPKEAAEKSVNFLYGDRNLPFMSKVANTHLDSNGTLRPQSGPILNQMVNEGTTQRIKSLQDQGYQVWNQYSKFAKEGYANVFYRTIIDFNNLNTIDITRQNAVAGRAGSRGIQNLDAQAPIRYNPQTAQFEDTRGRNGALENINAATRAVASVLKEEGGDINEFILNTFPSVPVQSKLLDDMKKGMGISGIVVQQLGDDLQGIMDFSRGQRYTPGLRESTNIEDRRGADGLMRAGAGFQVPSGNTMDTLDPNSVENNLRDIFGGGSTSTGPLQLTSDSIQPLGRYMDLPEHIRMRVDKNYRGKTTTRSSSGSQEASDMGSLSNRPAYELMPNETQEEWSRRGGVEKLLEYTVGADPKRWATTRNGTDNFLEQRMGESLNLSDKKDWQKMVDYFMAQPDLMVDGRAATNEEKKKFRSVLDWNYDGGAKGFYPGEIFASYALRRYILEPSEENKQRLFDIFMRKKNTEAEMM